MTENLEKREITILNAAKEVFIERGFEGAKMQIIADKAGINKALLHYYFRSKEKLFEAVFLEVIGKIIPPVMALMESHLPFESKIRGFVSHYIDSLKQNPLLPMFILRELNRNPERLVANFQKSGVDPQVFLISLVKEIDDGNIRPFDPTHMLVNILSLCVFPFAAKPLLKGVFFDNDENNYDEFLEQRKETVSRFIINAIRN